MQTTTILRREHAALRTALAVLEKVAAQLGHDLAVASDDVDAVLAYLVDVGERCHCAREEQLLFPVLKQRGSSRDAQRITVLVVEHDAAREVLRTLTHLSATLATDPDSRRAFAETVRTAAPMLRDHLEREERTLFPLAEGIFTPEDDAKFARDFATHDRTELGETGERDRWQALAEITARYGVQPQHE